MTDNDHGNDRPERPQGDNIPPPKQKQDYADSPEKLDPDEQEIFGIVTAAKDIIEGWNGTAAKILLTYLTLPQRNYLCMAEILGILRKALKDNKKVIPEQSCGTFEDMRRIVTVKCKDAEVSQQYVVGKLVKFLNTHQDFDHLFNYEGVGADPKSFRVQGQEFTCQFAKAIQD